MSPFAPGSAAAIRGLYRGRVWHLQTARVVDDSDEATRLVLLPGAECRVPSQLEAGKGWPTVEERWRVSLSGEWSLAPWIWKWTRALVLLEPDRPYAILHYWNADSGAFLGWYVNFQLPYRRSAVGFDTFDLDLDLLVGPDRRWAWKDEAEYAEGVRLGGIEPAWKEAVEDARTEVLARIEAAEPPFDGAWIDWAPDASWEAPRIPANWDAVE